jgi:hypothetical protein
VNGGNGSTTQYGTYPTNSSDFDKWFNTQYSNSTLFGSGGSTPNVIMDYTTCSTLTSAGISIPNSCDYFAVQINCSFTPRETGTYTFTAESDDSVDLFINGTNVASFYGGRGTPPLGTTTGTISLTAGSVYTMRVRTQEYAGGEGLRIFWKRPSESGGSTWYQYTNEVAYSGSLGPNGSQGAQGNLGFTGPTGYQGPQGSQGGQGSQGFTGPVGATGPKGSQGPVGAQGFQGPTGFPGPIGPTGGQGSQGAQGPQGLQGAVGAIGVQGLPGAPGLQGSQGSQGSQGGQGSQGPQGPRGSQGAVGFLGAQPQGPAGPQGPQGPQGAQGVPGFQGSQSSLQGAQGGANETTGAAGVQGAQGNLGFGPLVGSQGSQGTSIGSGPQGSQGAQGGQGSQGLTGSAGAQGAQGATPSDSRMKKNVRPIEDSLNKVMKMRGVSFIWNKDGLLPNYGKDIGFIAQEVAHVLPELVFKSEKENSHFQVKYNDVIALCLEAIKEQSRLIDLKEERLEKLENKAKEKGLV